MISDQLLVERMAAGDREAFELLVTRYHGPLLSYVTNRLKDRSKAEDIVQETFIRLIRHLKRHGGMEHLRPWLYTVALNLCRDYWRSASYRSEHGGADELPDDVDPSPQAEELIERQETAQQLAESLALLPQVQQEVVRMRFFHELKLQEIAEMLEMPLSSVKSNLYSALRKLKRALCGPKGASSAGSGERMDTFTESEVPIHGTLH
ncbi:MAG: RNA polymerase sigma factor [Paenibacillus macerans]|uniref:RNA polymerase sigma factor, sigma-70 family protein n=1 Tax=Paenibacillus macerans TaxID=44252 RepID=A0A090ZDI7_PAEMA|nr:RNA polymerase sigma factor [Paenibacillus macerans]KFN08687.1 RNA polymerase sigma factor, sigma-70 family protein [Paenibacillus macerans]MBS5911763.1 RNA polymerase sigma factor [Paenibacillus macerans]MCY7560562.1 RNA polymerase sigma factor [Paenibacillus macerans]MDU5946014.1 RNA polymerase sigma factor [Paenibacillus macerans]MDU7476885.1 RNA polymerase sigma factor [Paenibacillus macerans]